MIRYDSYKDSGVEWIGEIPSHWGTTRIKYTPKEDKYSFIDGDWIESKNLSDDGVRYITTGNIGEGKYKEQGKGYITEETFEALKCTEIYEGDLIISRLSLPVGRSCILPHIHHKVVTSVDNVILRPKEEFDKYYLNYQFNSPKYFEYTELISRGVTLTRISRGMLGNNPIVIPPLSEQQQIVNFLDSKTSQIDELIQKKERTIELLKEYRLGVVRDIILNSKTKRTRLRFCADLITRPIERKEDIYYTKVGMNNWGRGIFKYDKVTGLNLGESEFNYLSKEDLLLSGQFSWEGAVSIVEDEFENCIASHRFHILRGRENILLTDYLWAYFTSQEGHFLLENNSVGSAGRNRPLNIGKLLNEYIPIPDLSLQQKLKEIVQIEKKANNSAKLLISLLYEYRQSLISEVVTGKIKVF
jgi:restriction endonuclease S subunit